ncbi:MAG TPA: AMP nucleosidase [Candidatus Sulfotelmatobacter sp.]|nr:AMP nucleosidase [Candidatus Sulfotelmatobacter sp.]
MVTAPEQAFRGYAAEAPAAFTGADAAVERIGEIYARSITGIRDAYEKVTRGGDKIGRLDGFNYPLLGMIVGPADLEVDARLSHGVLSDPGAYATTLTRPDLFAEYYRQQIGLLLQRHRVPVYVGLSTRPIPLPFAVPSAVTATTPDLSQAILQHFLMPDLGAIDDAIVNGTRSPASSEPKPLALFNAERVDFSLQRLPHYTGTSAGYFQRFVLFTNYQRYVEAFKAAARQEIDIGNEYEAFVEPGDVFTPNCHLTAAPASGQPPQHLPQMPAYHLVRADGNGITLIDIGVGPSNAKTITDHVAVLRPHCWIMLGHCAGLRRSQRLGDYVLAHAYAREDHVLDEDVPLYVPIPPIAEVQVALAESVAEVTGLKRAELKSRMRTGTVYSTGDRHWELRYRDLYRRLAQTRAIAVDMESATVATNGYRFRVPYGTLLCVSDKPYHGELKSKDAADSFYRERVSQHLVIGMATMRLLRDSIEELHSRKLRTFDEPGFR